MHAFDLSKVQRRRPSSCAGRVPGETSDHPGRQGTHAGREHAGDRRPRKRHGSGRHHGRRGIRNRRTTPRSVLFECAAFDRANNRVTSRKLGMRTEASGRFEKGVCPATAMEALERACMLVNMLGMRRSGARVRTTTIRIPSSRKRGGGPASSRICRSHRRVRARAKRMEEILERPEHRNRDLRRRHHLRSRRNVARTSRPRRTLPRKYCGCTDTSTFLPR